MEATVAEWVLIGVPTSAGAHHAGQERAPAALRAAGLAHGLREVGVAVSDAGDLPGATFAVDSEHPRARNLQEVVRVAGEVADAVSAVVATGGRPLVVGGDCTITIGAVAGLRRQHPGAGLVYVDADADLGALDLGSGGLSGQDDQPPRPDQVSGILDSAGVSYLLGYGQPELAGLDGRPPLLEPSRLAIVGCDPREVSDAERAFLSDLGVSYQGAEVLIAGPEEAARTALTAVASAAGPILVHFDVDLVDSGELPLGNFPHYGTGVSLEHAVRCLRVLCAQPACAGLVLTEVNPTHDPGGRVLRQYAEAIAQVLAV
jgi:arginase